MMRWIVLLAGVLGAIGVGIGAFAAHGLGQNLKAQGLPLEEIDNRLRQCDVAVRYHMFHVLALLTIGFLPQRRAICRRAAAGFFGLGIALFSGGLYSMVFLGEMGHWAIVPVGGLCFILGWLCTAGLAWEESRGRDHAV